MLVVVLRTLLLCGTAGALVLNPPVFLSGGLAASLGHTCAVPVDVLKTKQQNEPERYSGGIAETAAAIVREEGGGALLLGLGPTLGGYFLHGGLKYGLYDAFKPEVVSLLPPTVPPLLALIVAGVAAECVASTCLTPIEAARIRQVSDPEYAGLPLPSALRRLAGGPSGIGAAFDGLAPCLLKMCPYTAFQLPTYEVSRQALAPYVPEGAEFGSQLLCACLAAVLASLTSQPGDSLLSEANKCRDGGDEECALEDGFDGVLAAAQRLGPSGLFRGTGARLLQMLLIVVVQLLANDSIRQACGLPGMGR